MSGGVAQIHVILFLFEFAARKCIHSMEVSVLFVGTASATLRWLFKSIKSQSQPSKFTPDDLYSTPTAHLVMPMRTESGGTIGTMTMEFLFEMPSTDAFRLFDYDVLVFVAEKIGSEEQWNLHNIIEQRGLVMYNTIVGKPGPGSQLPIGLQVDYTPCTTIQQFIHTVMMPTITRKAKEINDAAEAKAAEAKKVAEGARAAEAQAASAAMQAIANEESNVSEVDEADPAYSEYNFQ